MADQRVGVPGTEVEVEVEVVKADAPAELRGIRAAFRHSALGTALSSVPDYATAVSISSAIRCQM